MTMIGRKRGWVIKLTCGSAKILAMSHVKKMIIKIDLKEESPEKRMTKSIGDVRNQIETLMRLRTNGFITSDIYRRNKIFLLLV